MFPPSSTAHPLRRALCGIPPVQVDDAYVSIQSAFVRDSDTGKEPRLDYLRRMLRLAEELPKRFPGQTIACYSHAASVALVGALTRAPTLCEVGTFAPCGVYKLVLAEDGVWHITARGDTNSGHISQNAPTTFPWGWQHIRQGRDEVETLWVRANELGPSEAACPSNADNSPPA